MGLFDDLFGGEAGKEAAEKNRGLYNQYSSDALGYLDTGYNTGVTNLNKGIAAYDPVAALGTKYGGATDLYLNSLGVNGAAGTAAAQNAFQTSPGYDFALNTGLDSVDRRAASRGMLGSGNTNIDTLNFSQGLANQEYGNWQNRLGSFVSPELQATSGAAAGQAAGYGSLANLGVSDSLSRVGVARDTTSGLTAANNQQAQAEMQGAGNLFGALGQGLSLGKSLFGMF